MPLQAGTQVAPPVPQPGAPTTPEQEDGLRATWIAPDGTATPLTTPERGWFTLDAVTGWGAAPIEMVTDPHPRGGTRIRHIQPQARIITWPLRVRANEHVELVARWRTLVRAFAQTRRLGPGTLRIARPDGTSREIQAYYQEGFAGEPGQGWLWDTAVLSLYCEDPYWRDTTATVIRREYATGSDFFTPYPTISSSQVLGETTVVNPGEVEAWPEWTITGPATGLIATNNTTGEQFTLTAALDAGETATITTDPPTVRGPAGENWVGNLDWPGAVLWGLAPGTNDVEFQVAGSGPGSAVELSLVARYEAT